MVPETLFGAEPSAHVWTASSQEMIPLQGSPAGAGPWAGPRQPVRLDVFRGEVEAFQVIVMPTSEEPLTDLSLDVQPLRCVGDATAVIPSHSIHWFRVGYLNRQRADVLMPVRNLDMVRGERFNYPIWVRLHMPRRAVPGFYRGYVTARSGSDAIAKIPLEVKVWRTGIPRQAHFNTAEFGFWERHAAAQMGIPEGSTEMRRLLTRGAEMLADHRIVHDNDSIGPVPYKLPHDPLSLEGQNEILRWCKFWASRGLRLSCSFRVTGMNPTPEQKDYARRFWAVYGPLLRERGWDRMVYTKVADEWHGNAGAQGCRDTGRFLKSLMPTLQIAATSIGTDEPVDFDRWLGHFRVAGEVVTLWGQTEWNHLGPFRWDHPFRDKLDGLRQFLLDRAAAGDHVWLYIHACLFMRPEDDLYKIRSFFWQLSRYGFDGCWLWGVTAWGDQPENRIAPDAMGLTQAKPYGATLGDGVLFWPGNGQLLESVRLELVRDGIEDWECFGLLSERLKRARRSPARYTRWIAQAERALQLRAGQVNEYVPPQGGFEHKTDPVYFAAVRRALGEALDATPHSLRVHDKMKRRDFINLVTTGLAAGFLMAGLQREPNEGGDTCMAASESIYTSLPIRVNNPRKLGAWQLPAERVVVGGAYKPSMALLPNGELVMVALFGEYGLPEGKIREWTGLWRSSDGGRTWSDRTEVKDLIGREQWLTCTKEGTLFATCHLLAQDINNKDGYSHSYLHRSTDGARTWERTRIGPEGFPEKASTTLSRNVVELPDGTLLLGVGVNELERGTLAYVWTSRDGGKMWDKSAPRVKLGGYQNRPYDNWDGFFSEDFTFLAKSGKFLHFIRCGPPSPMYPMNDGRITPSGDDGIDRMLRCESTDSGQTWSDLRDHGDYGMHYPRVLRLQDGRLMMTFTQRSTFYPLGLQAVLSYDEGETWDFHNDRLIIEGKTPWGMPSGGGFGNTVQLQDGTLVSCYTYRGVENATHLEVVRWRLPK